MRKNSVPTKSISHHVPKIFRFLLAYLAHLDCLHTGTFHFSGVLPLDKRTAGFACYNFPGCWSNSYFDYNTFSHCRWYSIPTSATDVLIDPPDGPLLVIYGNVLPFTTNWTFLTIVNKNIYNQKFPNQLYYI